MRAAWWLSVAMLVAVLGGCQLAAQDGLRRRGPRPRPARPALAAPVAELHPAGPEAPPAAAPPGLSDPAATADDGEERKRMVDELARLREAFLSAAKDLVGNNGWGSIPAASAQLADRISQVPGWRTVPAEDLDLPLREVAVHALVCRGLLDGAGACISADALLPGGAALCVDAVRVLQQARALRQGLAFERAAKAVGFPDEPALAQAARAALVDGDAADCARLGPGPGEPTGWSESLCRVLAAGDPARCEEQSEPVRRAMCRGLARALLDTVGRTPPSARPVEEMYRRWSLGGDAIPECLAEPLAVLVMHPLVQAAFVPTPAADRPVP